MKWPESPIVIQVSMADQLLTARQQGKAIFTAPVSTSARGPGFEEGSYQTPTGNFVIREKIGEGAPLFTSFKGRLPRRIWHGEENKDAILTRILRLEGLDDQNANTYRRFIYFHGTHAEDQIGKPASHGCIRLKNDDMLTLFELTPIGSHVQIQ